MADVIEKCGIFGDALPQGQHGVRVRVPAAALEADDKPDFLKEEGAVYASQRGLDWVMPYVVDAANASRERRAEWHHLPKPTPFTVETIQRQYYV